MSVTDDCGNTATCTTVVTVVDVTPPTIVDCGIPHPVTPSLFPFTITPNATDACTSSSEIVFGVGNLQCTQYAQAKNLFTAKTADKDSCDHAGLTFLDGAGVFTVSTFDLSATDSAGNEATKECRFLNNHPVKGRCLHDDDCGLNGNCNDETKSCECIGDYGGPLCDIYFN